MSDMLNLNLNTNASGEDNRIVGTQTRYGSCNQGLGEWQAARRHGIDCGLLLGPACRRGMSKETMQRK